MQWTPPTIQELDPLFPNLSILKELGRGGMGAVYQAQQSRLDRLVAVKILAPGFEQSPGLKERFEREPKAMARLKHPNIVEVYDAGQIQQNGYLYYVMEYVEGTDLSHLISQRTLTVEKALDIALQVCDALDFAHRHGVVHRDIKPANILLEHSTGTVKVTDFGIAKLARSEDDFTITGNRESLGTPEYAAPEQTRRGANKVDGRADLFSLGVVLYEMLTGERPKGNFARPSANAKISSDGDRVILKTLEQDPRRRYSTANQLKRELPRILSSPGRRGTKRGKEWAWMTLTLIVVTGFLAAAGILVFSKRIFAAPTVLPAESEPGRSEERPNPSPNDWKPVFNGRDLTGWGAMNRSDSFSVREGVLIAEVPSGITTDFLWFEGLPGVPASLANFELRATIKADSNANSGIYFHCSGLPAKSGRSLEGYELALQNDGPLRFPTGALYGVTHALTPPEIDQRQWFDLRLRVTGRRIQVWLNEEPYLDYTEPGSPVHPAESGRIRPSGENSRSKPGTWVVMATEVAHTISRRSKSGCWMILRASLLKITRLTFKNGPRR